jgi:hypothetical protein
MAVQKTEAAPPRTEATPLLIDEPRNIDRDDGSSGTLTDSRRSDEEDVVDDDKANQHVGWGRGLLIMLSLCGLMFLQGVLDWSYMLKSRDRDWNYLGSSWD